MIPLPDSRVQPQRYPKSRLVFVNNPLASTQLPTGSTIERSSGITGASDGVSATSGSEHYDLYVQSPQLPVIETLSAKASKTRELLLESVT